MHDQQWSHLPNSSRVPLRLNRKSRPTFPCRHTRCWQRLFLTISLQVTFAEGPWWRQQGNEVVVPLLVWLCMYGCMPHFTWRSLQRCIQTRLTSRERENEFWPSSSKSPRHVNSAERTGWRALNNALTVTETLSLRRAGDRIVIVGVLNNFYC